MHKRIGVAVFAAWAASAVLLASTPTFWTVSTQPDFLKGDVENLSIDSDGRVFLGPVDRAGRRNLGAVPLDGPGRRRRHAVGRNGQRRPGPEDRARRQDLDLLRRRRDGSARARARAERRPLRRDLARRQDLPSRRRRHVEDLLRSRRQVHLGAGRRARRRALRRHRRKGHHLPDHARRQGLALLQDQHHQRGRRSRSTRAAT